MTFVLSVKDTYRQAVEAATGGKNTVMYDDKGNPSIMVCIPRFNLSDVIDGAPNSPHPAFIVDGVVKNEIWISKYQNIVYDNRAYSIPGQDPRANVNFDQAKEFCSNKGPGWHLMTNAEWAAIALWCKKNGTQPRGNNNYGADHSAPYERGKVTYQYNDSGTIKDGRVATGSGPISWSHDGTSDGIYDLNGNLWEWVDGLRVENGKILVHNDNDFGTPTDDLDQWVDTGSFFDNINGLVLNSSRTTAGTPNKAFESLTAAAGYTIPDLLKYLAIAPIDSGYSGDFVYTNLESTRFPLRGGYWPSGAYAGVFSLNVSNTRSGPNPYFGFRSAYIQI